MNRTFEHSFDKGFNRMKTIFIILFIMSFVLIISIWVAVGTVAVKVGSEISNKGLGTTAGEVVKDFNEAVKK